MSVLSTLGALSADQAGLRARLAGVTRQVSTGQAAPTLGGLGAEARRAIDLRAELGRRDAHVTAAGVGLGRMAAAQSALARIETVVGDVAAEALRARSLGAPGAEALARSAGAALEEVARLLNATHDGGHVFAGPWLDTAPVPPAALAALRGAAAAGVAGLGPLPADGAAVLAGMQAAALAPATTPFAPELEALPAGAPRRAVPLAEGDAVAWGVLANRDAAGNAATGWGREALRHLATLAAITPAAAAQGAGFDALLAGAQAGLAGAAAGVAAERGALGAAERRVEAGRERHRDMLVVLRAQLGAVEEVDVAEATSRLRAAELRLQASYEATAMVARLSLAQLLR